MSGWHTAGREGASPDGELAPMPLDSPEQAEEHDLARFDCICHCGLSRLEITPEGGPSVPALRPPYRDVRVVALGGGTGLPILLRGLKAALFPAGWGAATARDRDRLTAIVTVADDGGSSGRLRQAYRILAPGDIRNCLLALADADPSIAAIFEFRFNGDGEVGGHSLGNLILTALSQLESDFPKAVERAGEILAILGRVLPATTDDVTLLAQFADGSVLHGESRIASVSRPIRCVQLQPDGARALPRAREAIAAANLIVLGPGSLYTSLMPILLVKELAEAIAASRARVVLVMNLMTEPGETNGYNAADLLLAIRRHAPRVLIHDVLLNTTPIAKELVARYAAEGARPIPVEVEALQALRYRPVARELLGSGLMIHHDPHKLARAVLELAR